MGNDFGPAFHVGQPAQNAVAGEYKVEFAVQMLWKLVEVAANKVGICVQKSGHFPGLIDGAVGEICARNLSAHAAERDGVLAEMALQVEDGLIGYRPEESCLYIVQRRGSVQEAIVLVEIGVDVDVGLDIPCGLVDRPVIFFRTGMQGFLHDVVGQEAFSCSPFLFFLHGVSHLLEERACRDADFGMNAELVFPAGVCFDLLQEPTGHSAALPVFVYEHGVQIAVFCTDGGKADDPAIGRQSQEKVELPDQFCPVLGRLSAGSPVFYFFGRIVPAVDAAQGGLV